MDPLRLEIPVYYDFASTICYVAHRVVERMTSDLDALAIELVWRPIDMTTIAGWPRGSVVEGPRRENALRVARELGVEARMPGEWLDSRAAGCVARALAGTAKEPAWRERVWSAVFDEGRDPGDDETIEALGRDLGIDTAPLIAPAAYRALEEASRAARAAEVTGVPTFDLGFPLGGIQDPRTMLDLISRWAERKRAGLTGP